MNTINFILGCIVGFVWMASLYLKWGVLISISFGILMLIFFFLDDLLWKPINLIEWKIAKEDLNIDLEEK